MLIGYRTQRARRLLKPGAHPVEVGSEREEGSLRRVEYVPVLDDFGVREVTVDVMLNPTGAPVGHVNWASIVFDGRFELS